VSGVKTQHCPNCEATEQKLHDFRQEVSDAVETYFKQENYLGKFNDTLGQFIIPAPKPDPLVEVMKEWFGMKGGNYEDHANDLRAALETRGLEIKEKDE
jgi:hypothetical protein